ncbi:MAG: hypothetical protein ACW98X_16625 [Promethearchaeota archaeon]|jgi:transposase
MVESDIRATRKGLKGDRVAICPKYGCYALEKLKPMKLGIFGIRKYPKCKTHKIHLVFVDEFIGDFLKSVNACLYDDSALPPKDLLNMIKISNPEMLSSFFHRWIYCFPMGRGADMVHRYLDSLSRAYIKSLTRRQKKSIQNEISSKKRDKLIILGFKKIEMEFIEFLKRLYETSENSYNIDDIKPFNQKLQKLIQGWLEDFLNTIRSKKCSIEQYVDDFEEVHSIIMKKKEYDKILQARTCMLLLGNSPVEINIKIPVFELFMAYREFFEAGICQDLNLSELDNIGSFIENFKFKSLKIDELKGEIRNIDWEKISSDWIIDYQARYSEHSTRMLLNPKKNSNKDLNPLYRHSKWLGYLYKEKELSYRQIAEICNVDKGTIIYWAKKHNLPKRKEIGKEWVDKHGYICVYTPKGYFHPELTPLERGDGRYIRRKHRLIMEEFLSSNPKLKISKSCMIDGKYLKTDCLVHHINFNKLDNRMENLWVFEKRQEHYKSLKSLYNCFSELIKLSKIVFRDGAYVLRKNFNITYSKNRIKELLEPRGENFYKDIKNVKDEVKKINWDNLNSNWTVKYRQNQFQPFIEILLNPYSDCSEKNPLYRHRGWLNFIVNDKRFNLSDSRLGKLCGITKDKAKGWRQRLRVSRGRNWGFKRFINEKGRVYIKPENYPDPIVLRNKGWILEHRYIMEMYLKSQANTMLSNKYLDKNGFLKPNIIIHHLNFDPSDNRIENLIILFSESEHKTLEYSLLKFVEELLKTKQIRFLNGKYQNNI